MRTGYTHLVPCRCVLPQFKTRPDPPRHQFIVFSVLEDDIVVPKTVQCNNCGVVHRVTDVCKSNILGKDEASFVMTIDDVKSSLPANLTSILDRHDLPLHVWEKAQFVVENQSWGETVVLANELDGDTRHVKYVQILSPTFFKIDVYERAEILKPSLGK